MQIYWLLYSDSAAIIYVKKFHVTISCHFPYLKNVCQFLTRSLDNALKFVSLSIDSPNEGVTLSGITGGVAGGRDFIPLHYYTSLMLPNAPIGSPILVEYSSYNDTHITLEYYNDAGVSIFNTTVPYTNTSGTLTDYHIEVTNDRLYDSYISFNWLQLYTATRATYDSWAMDNIHIYLYHNGYQRMIFKDNFVSESESNNKWTFVYGSIVSDSECDGDSPCVLLNDGSDVNENIARYRYAQTIPLDARVVTYIDIPLAPTTAILYSTDCTFQL